MSDGLSVTGLADAWLNTINGTSFSASAIWVQLHVDTPGVNGTANQSAVTTRQHATFNTASGGSLSLSAPLTAWAMTSTETITDISVWSLASSGTFFWSAPLAIPKTVSNGDTLTLNTLGLSLSPLAA